MIAKKHTILLSVGLLLSASTIRSENSLKTEKKDSATEQSSLNEWTNMVNNFDLDTPNMKAARAAIETVGGVALCVIPSSIVVRLLGLATVGFGARDIQKNKETQDILYTAANTTLEKGKKIAQQAEIKWHELRKHISEKAAEAQKENDRKNKK